MSSNNYSPLDLYLHKLLKKKIALSEEDKKMYTSHLGMVTNNLINKMKECDSTFKILFKQIIYVGSYFEDMRVKKPDEFDINLELYLPVKMKDIELSWNDIIVKPGYTAVKISAVDKCRLKAKDPECWEETFKKITKEWLDENDYLLKSKLLAWFQGVVDKALHRPTKNVSAGKQIHSAPRYNLVNTQQSSQHNQFLCPYRRNRNYKVTRRVSGPAVTLEVSSKTPNIFYSVDLVPVISFNKWPPTPPIRGWNREMKFKNWYIVPKPLKEPFDHCYHLWRTSFHFQELHLLKNKNNLKPVIKVIKLLRDELGWHRLHSYHIKSIFLWELENQDKTQFCKMSLGKLLMHMLKRINYHLSEMKEIPYFWDERCNLSLMVDMEMKIISDRLTTIIEDIDRNLPANPGHFLKYFKENDILSP